MKKKCLCLAKASLKEPIVFAITTSVTRLGNLSDFGQVFKAFSNN